MPPRFEDYHRTVIGYHGTKRSTALEIVQGSDFAPSQNNDDWLGDGIYFWEHAPQQAWAWAERLRKKNSWNEEVAVLGSMIRLGNCLDLLDPYNVKYLRQIYEQYRKTEETLGRKLPANVKARKYLDCAVFRFAYAAIEESGKALDSARAVYVPTGQGKRAWPHSWIMTDSHVQICVRNPSCIMGTWLVKPIAG